MAKEPKATKVVVATGNAGRAKGVSGKAIEDAMTAATQRLFDEGIHDPEQILKAKVAAREDVKARIRAEQEAARKAAEEE